MQRVKDQIKYIINKTREVTFLTSRINLFKYSTRLSQYIKYFRHLRILSLSASAALIAIMTLAVFPIIRKASTAEATSLPSTTTLTMTTGSESADLSLLVSNASGTFSSSSSDELAKFSIATNNYTGYTLTISGSDDTGLLTNTDTTITTNNTFSSIDTAISETTFDNSIYNGKWGYLPSKYSSVDNTSFRPAPTTTASTLNVTNCANDTTNCPDTEDDYTIGLGIRADYTKPVGTYTNTFILTATANPVGYSITYADNTGDSTVADIPAIQSGVTSSTFVTLNPDRTPIRTGYTFRSWCLGDSTTDPTDPSTIVTNNGTICHGTEYAAGELADFVNQTIATSTVTLYAVWSLETCTITFKTNGANSVVFDGVTYVNNQTVTVPVGTYRVYGNYASKYAFKDFSVTTGSLADNHQITTYTVNDSFDTIILNGQLVNTTIQSITSSTCPTSPSPVYDVRDNQVYWIAKLPDGKCWMLDNLRLGAVALSQTLSTANTNMDANTSFSLPSSTATNFNNTNYAVPVLNSDYVDVVPNIIFGAGSGKIGVYYNFCAASAGTYCWGGGSTAYSSYDICPAGWHIPTGGLDEDYNTLYNAYSSDVSNMQNGLSLLLSGNMGDTSDTPLEVDANGRWWSSTQISTAKSNMYTLYSSRTGVNSVDSNRARFRGNPMRCISDGIYTLSLTNTNATTSGSTSVKVTYNSATVYDGASSTSAIANPQRKYTISGFTLPSSNNANSATVTYNSTASNNCTSASACTHTYTFNGWYTATSGGTRIITSAGALAPSTTYTNASSQWTYTNASSLPTLYSQWTAGTTKLPTITKTGYTCGWTTTATNATTITYASGASITPTANTTLYGVCTANKYSLTITFAGTGVASVQVRTAAGTGGTLMGTVSSSGGKVSNLVYGTAYYLYPTYSTGYTLSAWKKTDSATNAALSSTSAANPTYKIGVGNGAVTITGKTAYTMQNFTKSLCSTNASSANYPVTDSRDNQIYTVRYINGGCWMTKNLAIGCNGSGTSYGASASSKSLTSSNSNVSTTWSTPTASLTNGNSYNSPYMTCSSTYGAWYNYLATSAGTDITATLSYSVCPSGWRLPTNSEFSGITGYSAAFSPSKGGVYYDGSIHDTGRGFWWSANFETGSTNNLKKYTLYYNGSTLSTVTKWGDRGQYVRCIKS